MTDRITELRSKKESARQMGGPEKIAQQHQQGKLTARERIDLLFDAGTFYEVGVLAHSNHPSLSARNTPADGVITGFGHIDGRLACVAAYDYTVLAGSMGEVGERKVTRIRQWALDNRMPMIWLIDSAGARIQESTGSQFAESGKLFFDQVIMSGVVPQVAAMMGPGAAGTAYIPALSDFVPMVRGTSSMALGGPHLVKAAIGEDVSEQELGGSQVHCTKSGVADLEVENDEECIRSIKRFLSYLPSHNQDVPPEIDVGDPPNRLCEELNSIVPDNPKMPYNMYDVIYSIVDRDSFFEIKPGWAKNLITGFARFNGISCGILANQPMVRGGILDIDSADKATRFMQLCDAFNVPLIFLQDVPGFIIGSRVEKLGIIRHGAKMLFAVSEATVPKVTVILRKAYGAGYFVMCGKQYEPDLIVGWPTAEISVMGPEGAVNIIFRKEIFEADNPEELRNERCAAFRKLISPYLAAANHFIDDIIEPAETRKVIINALTLARNKKRQRPWRKHGVMPV